MRVDGVAGDIRLSLPQWRDGRGGGGGTPGARCSDWVEGRRDVNVEARDGAVLEAEDAVVGVAGGAAEREAHGARAMAPWR
jgi:hypothetical protein